MGDCGCGKKRERASAQQGHLPFPGDPGAALTKLRQLGCSCPLVYDTARQEASTKFASTAQLSRCPYHGVAGALSPDGALKD